MFELFDPKYRTLAGKNGLVLGIANRDSIAYGCAKAFKTIGAELALTYLMAATPKPNTTKFVSPI